MQPSAPLLRQRKIEPAEGLNAKLGSIVLCEELGDRALGAIKCNRAVCADDITPFIARRAEWKGSKEIGGYSETLVRVSRHRARDKQRGFTHLDIDSPADVVDQSVRLGGRGSMLKQNFVQGECGGGQMGREDRAESRLDRNRKQSSRLRS